MLLFSIKYGAVFGFIDHFYFDIKGSLFEASVLVLRFYICFEIHFYYSGTFLCSDFNQLFMLVGGEKLQLKSCASIRNYLQSLVNVNQKTTFVFWEFFVCIVGYIKIIIPEIFYSDNSIPITLTNNFISKLSPWFYLSLWNPFF